MNSEARLLFDLLMAVGAGWLGGLVARAVKAPLVVGYLAAGAIIGPHALGVIKEGAEVHTIAGLGVVLLLFALGVELSPRELLHVRKVAVWGGGAQVSLTIVLGYLLGWGMGWDLTARVVLGFALALGSTAVIVKSLSERGEVHTQHAKVVVGINVVQDLAAVALVGLLPILGLLAGSQLTTVRIAGDLGLLGAKTAMFIGVILLLARTAVPRVLRGFWVRRRRCSSA
jgi:CPA2 family monovalent cation:H+ antiporter-2